MIPKDAPRKKTRAKFPPPAKASKALKGRGFLWFLLLNIWLAWGCSNMPDPRSLELQRSFRNFVFSVDELNQKGLEISVFFPGVGDYKQHVQELLLAYLEQAKAGFIQFDDQGVALTRFLGLTFHRYQIISLSELDTQNQVQMRLGIHFSYDKVIGAARYEKGTQVFVPGSPFGKVHTLIIGQENEIPREQLSYIEIDVTMKKTNHEGFWQVRRCLADRDSTQFETSYNAHD